MLSERENSPNNKKFILTKDNDALKDLNNYLPNLLTYLWEHPKIVALLLSNSNINDIKNNLASLIINNFYENILSSNYIEDNLMYVLTLMIKTEINNLHNINEPELFLDGESPVRYLLYELRRKNDIQYFFKNVILKVIDDLEVISSKSFNLNIQDIVNNYRNINESIDKENKEHTPIHKKNKSINADDLFKKQLEVQNETNLNFEELKMKQWTEAERAKFDEFSEKYLANLTISEIKKMIEENYNNDKNMKDYCYNQIINCEKVKDNELYYSNAKLIEKLYQVKGYEEILYFYQSDFLQIIGFIEQILTNLKNNLYILPYSVKCLCKIISILIQKKFPNISTTQKNAYIAEFLFKQLLIPILKNPATGVLINNFIISKTTLLNLKIINEILVQFVSGKFFIDNVDNDYTPFNWYFLEKMPDILEIFEKITKVTLPHFIEELLNDRLDENYQYNYFIENPDEIIFHRSICFNLNDISALLNSLDKCKDKIFIDDTPGFIFKKTFEKLNSNKNRKLLDELKNKEEIETTPKEISKPRKSIKKAKGKDKENIENDDEKKKTHFFLLTSLVANDKYKELFELKLDQKANYTIKELKKTDNESDIKINNIIKVKNFFSSLLYNYRKLIITDFDQGTTSNTIDILRILKTFIKCSNYVVDDSIPSEWYIDSLLDYLNKLPEELTQNDFEKIYDEIEEELNRAIKKLDFDVISVCLDRLKFTKRGKNYYEEAIKTTKDLELNREVQEIVEEEFIPVEMNFKYNNEQKIFDIQKSKIKDKKYEKKQKQILLKNNIFLCSTIKNFTEKFPNLSIFQEKQDIDIFDMQKELKIPEKLEKYFNIIRDYLLSNKKIPTSLGIVEINNKIYDYVMSKIYDKIFPKTNDKDDKIFSKSFMLSWAESKHLIPGKTNYVFDSFLPGVIDYFKAIDKEKSPRKKILYMKEIFNSISKVVKFNGGDENTGVDDQMPILNYAFIKAQPTRIYSNSRLMELYIGDMSSKEEGSQLIQLIALCNFIVELTYKNLYGVTKEEFTRNCNNAALGRVTTFKK